MEAKPKTAESTAPTMVSFFALADILDRRLLGAGTVPEWDTGPGCPPICAVRAPMRPCSCCM